MDETGEKMDNDPLLAHLLNSDLKELLSISHIVLANSQVTNRHIERHYDMPVQCWSTLYALRSGEQLFGASILG